MRFADGLKVVLLAATFAVAGCDDEDGDSEGSTDGGDRAGTILGLTGDAAAGETVYTGGACVTDACHGADGMGTSNLADLVPASNDEAIVNTFLNGKGTMPSQAALSDQELADVLAYVNANFGG